MSLTRHHINYVILQESAVNPVLKPNQRNTNSPELVQIHTPSLDFPQNPQTQLGVCSASLISFGEFKPQWLCGLISSFKSRYYNKIARAMAGLQNTTHSPAPSLEG